MNTKELHFQKNKNLRICGNNMNYKQHLEHNIFKIISQAAQELNLECYVIGGFVRDILLNRDHKKDIDIVMDICRSLAGKFLSAMGQIRSGQQKSAEWKICRLLEIFMENYGQPYDGKILLAEKISQQMMADMLGMNRVTITRKFKELRELSLVEQINGYICVRSPEALRKHMELMK